MENLLNFSVLELKAMAYDRIAASQQTQNELNAINQELSWRLQNPKQEIITPEIVR